MSEMSAADEGATAAELITALRLEPHPEGGHYRETWRGPDGPDGRAIGTAIHFLLAAGQRSHWHRVDAHELWLHHGGAPLDLHVHDRSGATETHRLGPDIASGHEPQAVVPAHAWQSATSTGAWSLLSCVVVPGFTFDGFELASPGWSPA